VFVSAVVPNIEELNAWLGGSEETVVRSDFRPAGAEYSVLRRNKGTGRNMRLALEIRAPSGTNLPTRSIPDFISVSDFEYFNETTKRHRTYNFDSYKTHAIAAARKALPLGTVAVFTRTKRGTQGVISLAEELADQLAVPLSMPKPAEFVTGEDLLADIGTYPMIEYGNSWVGTTALAAGAVVHHGDIPQETRDVFEEIVAAGNVRMVLCTSTLAEGVNLPIRTLVVYTTQISTAEGTIVPMLAREIRNLVGRAGRPVAPRRASSSA
jgi:replicative superfamily II helicase